MSHGAKPGQRKSKTILISIAVILTGVAVIAILMMLRANEKYDRPFPSDLAAMSSAAANLNLRLLDSPKVQNWISEKMKSSGRRVGVVNIWATWCEPCRDEMPELVKFQKSNEAPLFLISADNEVDQPLVRTFLHDKGVDFESVLIQGDQQEFVETWQKLSSSDPARQWSMSLPATFLVGSAGEVISFSIGTTTSPELAGLVKKTLETLRATNRD